MCIVIARFIVRQNITSACSQAATAVVKIMVTSFWAPLGFKVFKNTIVL